MYDFEKIPLPTEERKKCSIQFIVSNGMPQQQRLTVCLADMLRTVGLRGAFFSVGDCAFISILISILIYVLLFTVTYSNAIYCVFLFVLSPFMYALLNLLTIWKEIMTGTYEQKMVCRYSLYQINTLRMLIFGGVSVVMTVIFNTLFWLWIQQEVSLLRLMGISFSGLFLFGAIQIIADRIGKSFAKYFVAPALWIFMGMLLLIFGSVVEQLLLNIPKAMFCLLIIGAAVLYAKNIYHYYFDNKEGALHYAFN